MTCGSVLMLGPAGTVADVACGTENIKGGGGGNESLTGWDSCDRGKFELKMCDIILCWSNKGWGEVWSCGSPIRWETSLWPTLRSTPGKESRNWAASLAQELYPCLNLVMSSAGFRWLWLSFWICLTVNSRISAFSNLLTFSPSVWRHPVIISLSSSKQALILALLFLSNNGFVTFLYCIVFDIGGSVSSPWWWGLIIMKCCNIAMPMVSSTLWTLVDWVVTSNQLLPGYWTVHTAGSVHTWADTSHNSTINHRQHWRIIVFIKK